MENKICYYCGYVADDGNQHIPMRFFFPKEFRENLIKVPSCKKHNRDIQELEKLALVYIIQGSDSEEATNHFLKKVIKDLERKEREKVKFALADEFDIETNTMLLKHPNTLSDYMKYVISGLFFRDTNKVLQGEIKIVCNKLIEEKNIFDVWKKGLRLQIALTQGNVSNKKIFDYKYVINKNFIHYWCCFYEQTEFISMIKIEG